MTDSKAALRAFGALLAAKGLLGAALSSVSEPGVVHLTTGALCAVALLGAARSRPWGATAFVGAAALTVVTSFPHTLNHRWFELVVALVLWRAAVAPVHRSLRTVVHARVVLQLAILSVFFFSGLQKIAHGQFLSGEHLLREMAMDDSTMSWALRKGASVFGSMPSIDATHLVFGSVPLPISASLVTAVRVTSVGIVGAEILLPLGVACGVFGARWLLLAAQIGIGLVSAEIDFALTATGALLLLWRAPPRAAWIATFVGWLAVGVVIWGGLLP